MSNLSPLRPVLLRQLLFAFAVAASDQPTVGPDSVLSPADLRADLATLREVYGAMHPGLYRYNTPAQLAARFDSVDTYFSSPRTLGEAFLALTRLTASIKCGHSYPNFWNQSRRTAAALFEGRNKLPAEFQWIDGRMIVTADRSAESALPRGTEILSVNGVRARVILDSLMPYARADGHNDDKRVSYLGVQGRSRYHAFDILYPLAFGFRDSTFALELRRPDGRRETRRLRALSLPERQAQGEARATVAEDAALWSYDEEGGIGVLRMPTWSLYNSKWNATGWLDTVMRGLVERNVPDLVVDLRRNEGGVDAGNQILAHLLDAPVSLPEYRHHVRYRSAPEHLRPYLDTWDRSFADWGEHAIGPDSAGWYRLTRWDPDSSGREMLRPQGPRYRGRVWVLVGAVNSSATFQFALAVKQTGLATLVGQPTGGNRRGINGSAFFFVRLPRTGLEVDMPLVAGFPATDEPDAGVEPDIRVVPSVAQVAAGVDAELEAVRRRIRAQR